MFTRLLKSRQGGALLLLSLFLIVSLCIRLALLIRAAPNLTADHTLPVALLFGFVYDLGAGLIVTAPLALFLTLLPARFFTFRFTRALAHVSFVIALSLLLFGVIAEWLFWDEFSVRFNFIAVDYLAYTQEVIGNIRQSYPMPAIFGGLVAVSALLYYFLYRTRLVSTWLDHAATPPLRRFTQGGAWVAAAVAAGVLINSNQLPNFPNTYNREIAKNGLWSLFSAFWENELDFNQFYQTIPLEEAFAKLHTELAYDNSTPLPSATPDTLRLVHAANPAAPELHLNVIQITVESLSADFLSIFNRASHLTPSLTALAEHSLVFENFYATGTRTDRGMEALTLSIPPTPGRSLLKRKNNSDLFTLGSVFRSRGYDTAFIYGGDGRFDDMNTFFGPNGYRVVDKTKVARSDITFSNAWGACDEDLYRWTMREADQVAATGKPFHFFVMTTSNHRPYTYPEGRIDLPSKVSGRSGAVKYTDFAIGQFIKDAANKPWFKNTIFVIVGDHCASVAGKSELPVQNYHIPLFIYAPGGQVAPGRVPDLCSQIDYAPTLLGLLNWTYASRFYGWDILRASGDRRALIGNYQRVGLYEPGALTVLRPVKGINHYAYDNLTNLLSPRETDHEDTDETIAYYQTASYLYKNGIYRALSPEEQKRLAASAPKLTQR